MWPTYDLWLCTNTPPRGVADMIRHDAEPVPDGGQLRSVVSPECVRQIPRDNGGPRPAHHTPPMADTYAQKRHYEAHNLLGRNWVIARKYLAALGLEPRLLGFSCQCANQLHYAALFSIVGESSVPVGMTNVAHI